MTRIDPFSPEQREAIKTEIKQEMRHEERRKRTVRLVTGLLIAFVVIAVPVLFVSAQLAKTGFFDVPVLSAWLYKPTAPTRTVIPLYGSKPDDIYRVVGTKISYDPATSLAKLPMTEAEITTIAQHGVTAAPPESLPFPIKTMQVAIDPGSVEIYVVSPQKKRDATVRVRFRPQVKDGSLKASVQEIAVGSLIVPNKVGELLFSIFGAFVTDSVSKSIGQVGTLSGIELEQGIVRFVFYPKNR
ncbi:MAG TPA: hypothetical protein VL500_05935 [Candidatus Eisenbacteria bacterium]|jgi:hypothetical protein|nr:hypothetical protein [Candidatus Eisenbacteria bacterium]